LRVPGTLEYEHRIGTGLTVSKLLPDLNTSDTIAALAVLVAVISMIVTVFASYVIARAQGTFRKQKLLASFDTSKDYSDPWLIILNTPRLSDGANVTLIYFIIKNLGSGPLTNVSIQFNLYPSRWPATLAKPFEDGRFYSLDERDVIELKFSAMAPDEGTVIGVPYVVEGPRRPGQEGRLGNVSAYITYDQGRRIIKSVTLAGMVEQDFERRFDNSDSKLLDAIRRVKAPIVYPQGGVRLQLGRALFCAVFNRPFEIRPWLAYNAEFVPIEGGVHIERRLLQRREPTVAFGHDELRLLWPARLQILGIWISLFVLYLVGWMYLARRFFHH
jgi:hypothetical protein